MDLETFHENALDPNISDDELFEILQSIDLSGLRPENAASFGRMRVEILRMRPQFHLMVAKATIMGHSGCCIGSQEELARTFGLSEKATWDEIAQALVDRQTP